MSELKRVAFTTLTSGGGINSSSNLDVKKSSSTLTTLNPTAAAFLQAHESSTISSATATTAPSTSMHQASSQASQFIRTGSATNGNGSDSIEYESGEGSSSEMPAPSASMTSHNQTSKTIRLVFELFEPTKGSFPEFYYTKLVHAEKKKLKKLSKVNGFSDPFEENDDEVARIAKELEKKYGGTYGNANSAKRGKKDDYYDKGAGYDESDSFIDNTEAYDEIIPEEVETVCGGFYINSGALEFQHLSNYERPDDAIKMPKAKKRALSSSSSSDDEPNNEAEVETVGNTSPKDISNTANKLKNGHMEKKPKTSDNSDKESNAKMKYKEREKKSEKLKLKGELRDEDACSDSGKEKDKEKAIKTTTIKDMLKAKRDSFRKMQEEDDKIKLINGESMNESDSSDSDTSADESESDDEPDEKKFKKGGEDDCEKMRLNDVKLPEELTPDILGDIQELKDTVKLTNQSGKSFQFDEKMIELFLRIDDACSCLEKHIRNQVFAHLEYQMSLSKYFLLRKAKSLRIKQEKIKTKKAFMKLRKAVAEVMPSILLNYESNWRRIDEIRSSVGSTELEKIEQLPKYPKKKFLWNETLRNLLYELFQVRWTSFAVLRTRKETFDDFVNNYLKEKVVPVWPGGWMKFEDLQKELEKRKISAKKPKENKKPGENISCIKKNDETGKSSYLGSDVSKSILSSSNSVSVVSTKDLVVTISTKSDKSKEVPNVSAQSNSVSLTQMHADGNLMSNSTTSSKTDTSLSCLMQQKIQKSNSTNSNKRSSSTNSVIENANYSSQKQTGQNSSNNSSSKKSSSQPSNGKHSNTSSISNHQSSTNNSDKYSNKSQTELLSPTKRATDHSINSIMSSSPPHHSSAAACSSPPLAVSGTSNKIVNKNSNSNKTTDTATTHIINVDNLKNTSDIINTSNQLLSNSNGTVSSSSANNVSNSAISKEGSIRIRTVANVNSSLEKERKKESATHSKTVVSRNDKNDHESSSESDGVEIVGVFPVISSKSTNIKIDKSKYKKEGKSVSRSNSPNKVSVHNVVKANYKQITNPSNSNRDDGRRRSTGEIKDSELDVNQIMKALKELEQMQQSSIHISDGSPPTSHNRSPAGSSHTSPVPYGSPSLKKPSSS